MTGFGRMAAGTVVALLAAGALPASAGTLQALHFTACGNPIFRYDSALPSAKYHLDLAFNEINGGSSFLTLVGEDGLTAPVLTGQSSGSNWALQLKMPPYHPEVVFPALTGSNSLAVEVTFFDNGSSLDLVSFHFGVQAKDECK